MTKAADSIEPIPQARLPSKPEELLRTHDDRDAQELPELHVDPEHSSRRVSVVSEASTAEDLSTYTSHTHRVSLRRQTPLTWYHKLASQWENHVSVKVPASQRRDHLALERTYLGYLRTSVALSMVGVTVAQLFRLQSEPLPNGELGYYAIGIPLAAAFIVSAIAVATLGAVRYWRQQRAMTRGKVHAGGWEVLAVMGISILVRSVILFQGSTLLTVVALPCNLYPCACGEGSGKLKRLRP